MLNKTINLCTKFIGYLFLLLAVFNFSCQTKTKSSASPDELFKGKKITSIVKHASLFDIYKTNGVRKIVVHSPFDDTATAAVYYLVDSNNYMLYKSLNNVLPFPLHNIAVLSTTQLDGIIRLGLLSVVQGVADQKYIHNKDVHQELEAGRIEEVSANGQLFVEKTIQLNPQTIFFSPFKKGKSLPVNGRIKAIPFFALHAFTMPFRIADAIDLPRNFLTLAMASPTIKVQTLAEILA